MNIKGFEDELLKFLVAIDEVRSEHIDTENVCYSKITLYLALKKKIFFKNLLLHPKVLDVRPYYETEKIKTVKELKKILSEVLEYELTNDVEYLNKKERDTIIKVYNKILE